MELKAGKNRVEFKSAGHKIVGDLYIPEKFGPGQIYPAVVTGGPLATVKEQTHGTFSAALAQKGFIALAFDYRNFGESEGDTPGYECPTNKAEDIHNAISFLSSIESVDRSQINALGVCASSSYIASALVADKRVRSFATVSAHFSLHEFFMNNPLVTEEVKETLFQASNQARKVYNETGQFERNDMVFPDMTGDEDVPFLQEVYDYYFRRVQSDWPNYSNHLVPFSFEELVKSHALDYAKFINIPYLGIVGENAITRSYTERFIEAKADGVKQLKVLKGGTHMGSYAKDEYVTQAVDAITSFFQQ